VANLTFSDLLSEVYDQTGLDSTDSANVTRATRWLNYVQQDICARWPWPFMQGREDISTVADVVNAGTVSVNLGNTSVTGVGTGFTSTMASGQYFIQFAGGNSWYKIATAPTETSLTIDLAYQGTTNLVGGTYIIRKFFYSLSSAADRIIDIRNWNTPLKLIMCDPRQIDDLRPNPQDTNSSYGYVMWGVDSSGNIQFTPYPFPSDARVFEIRTNLRPVDGSVSIPNKYAHIIAFGATSVGFAYLRKFDEAAAWGQKFETRLMQMKSEYRMSEDSQPILRSIDSVQRAKWIQMPESYPVITG
jgi:hypothetical protein